jgi:hypothetical protein
LNRSLPAVLSILLLGVPLAACGDDDDEREAAEAVVAAFEFSGTEDNPKLSGPRSVEAGAVRVDFKNSSREDAGVQLLRIEGDHTAAEAVRAGEAWDDGKPLPEWIRFVGGSASVSPGGTFSAIQELDAGNYAAVDINTNEFIPLEVTGDGDAELPSTSATIEAVDYSFEARRLRAGKRRVLFTNKGKEPHFALAAPIRPGKTFDDVRESIRTEEGPPPIIEEETVSTGVLDGGRSQVVELELRKGRYAFVCFVPDRKGGPPHVEKGMISEGVVE